MRLLPRNPNEVESMKELLHGLKNDLECACMWTSSHRGHIWFCTANYAAQRAKVCSNDKILSPKAQLTVCLYKPNTRQCQDTCIACSLLFFIPWFYHLVNCLPRHVDPNTGEYWRIVNAWIKMTFTFWLQNWEPNLLDCHLLGGCGIGSTLFLLNDLRKVLSQTHLE